MNNIQTWIAVILTGMGTLSLYPTESTAFEKIERVYFSEEPLLDVPALAGCTPATVEAIMQEVSQIAGRNIHFVRLPWKRAQTEVQNARSHGIMFLTRNSRREEHYSWIAPLFPFKVAYITNKDLDPINSIEEARGRSIAIKSGTAAEFIAKKHQLPPENIVTLPTNNAILKMIGLGRIDGWLVWDLIAHNAAWQLPNPDQLVVGYSESVGDLYFAASKDLPAQEIEHWRSAFEIANQKHIIDRYLKCAFHLSESQTAMRVIPEQPKN